MKLSEDEIAKEIDLIDSDYGWPLWPILPMKHVERLDGSPDNWEVGILLAGEPDGRRTVWLTNLVNLQTGLIKPQLKDVEGIVFASTEELVRAGWIGD